MAAGQWLALLVALGFLVAFGFLVVALDANASNSKSNVDPLYSEPVSAVLSAINLVTDFTGWLFFYFLVNYDLPLRPQNEWAYKYTGLWHIYCLLSMNARFWSAIFHGRLFKDSDLAGKLDYSSSVALLGYSLILSLLRTNNVRDNATRVKCATPILAFTSHILYLNFYDLGNGYNRRACVAMGLSQILVWAVWARAIRHPSRFKLWTTVFGVPLAMLLEIFYDLPPHKGHVDTHALWHAATIPLTSLWWVFIEEDAKSQTMIFFDQTK